MKSQKRIKKRNPNDATFRNINALKKRVAKLEQWCEAITEDINNKWGVVSISKEAIRKAKKK